MEQNSSQKISDISFLLKEWDLNRNERKPEEISINSQIKFFWFKKSCNHYYEESPKNKITLKRGCLTCLDLYLIKDVNDYSIQFPNFESEYSAFNTNPYNSILINRTMLLIWWCNLGHLYESSLGSRIAGKGCPYCSNKKILEGFNDLESTHSHLMPYWDYMKNTINPKKVQATTGKYYWNCNYGHSWLSRITPQIKKSFSCPYCYGRYPVNGKTDLATTMSESLEQWDYKKNYPRTPKDFKKYSHSKVWWLCKENNHSYERAISKWSISPTCPKCHGNSSKTEKEFGISLNKLYNGHIITNTKKIITPYELDFFLPKLNIAIEYNGDYWHSDEKLLERSAMLSLDYHLMKKKLCENKNIKLFYVWESDWFNNKVKVKEEIEYILTGKFSQVNLLNRMK